MPGYLTVTGKVPDATRMLGEVDQAVGKTVQQVRPVVLASYRGKAPGRIAGIVKAKVDKSLGWKLTVYPGGRTMLKPAAYWTDSGTGIYRSGGKPIRRRARGVGRGHPAFRLPGGRMVAEFKGQKAQHWAADAKREADAKTAVIVQHEMPEQVSDQLRRWLG